MSIAAMADTKLARENPPPPPVNPGAPVGVSTGIVNQLTRWIPSETILLYVAFLSTFDRLNPAEGQEVSDLDFTSRWAALWAFTAVTAILVLLLVWGKANRNDKPFKWPFFELLISPVAFCAWASALPETPLQDFADYKVAVGGFILTATTVGVSVVAWATKRSPEYEKIVTQ